MIARLEVENAKKEADRAWLEHSEAVLDSTQNDSEARVAELEAKLAGNEAELIALTALHDVVKSERGDLAAQLKAVTGRNKQLAADLEAQRGLADQANVVRQLRPILDHFSYSSNAMPHPRRMHGVLYSWRSHSSDGDWCVLSDGVPGPRLQALTAATERVAVLSAFEADAYKNKNRNKLACDSLGKIDKSTISRLEQELDRANDGLDRMHRELDKMKALHDDVSGELNLHKLELAEAVASTLAAALAAAESAKKANRPLISATARGMSINETNAEESEEGEGAALDAQADVDSRGVEIEPGHDGGSRTCVPSTFTWVGREVHKAFSTPGSWLRSRSGMPYDISTPIAVLMLPASNGPAVPATLDVTSQNIVLAVDRVRQLQHNFRTLSTHVSLCTPDPLVRCVVLSTACPCLSDADQKL